LDVVVITFMLIAARFLWVWISLRFTIFRAKIKGEKAPRPHLRLVGATALAGVKGAITLAAY
jgi:NhaP-type Na+/H+ or K+/H+ antiporter